MEPFEEFHWPSHSERGNLNHREGLDNVTTFSDVMTLPQYDTQDKKDTRQDLRYICEISEYNC